ncbi:MAG TPA: hypothetical protein VFQ86_11850 [Arachidicoccus soli]|nr:hypothetical protein [Arachidicoccus soli]
MKKNKTNEPVFTWGSLVFTDPYEVIQQIFDFSGVGYYRNFIKDILLYSTRKKI